MSVILSSLHGPWLALTYAILVLAWLGSAAFPVLYAALVRWRDTEWGRHLMAFSAVVALATSNYMLRLAWPDYPGHLIVSWVVLLSLVCVCWWRVALFVKTYRRARRHGVPIEDAGGTA